MLVVPSTEPITKEWSAKTGRRKRGFGWLNNQLTMVSDHDMLYHA